MQFSVRNLSEDATEFRLATGDVPVRPAHKQLWGVVVLSAAVHGVL